MSCLLWKRYAGPVFCCYLFHLEELEIALTFHCSGHGVMFCLHVSGRQQTYIDFYNSIFIEDICHFTIQKTKQKYSTTMCFCENLVPLIFPYPQLHGNFGLMLSLIFFFQCRFQKFHSRCAITNVDVLYNHVVTEEHIQSDITVETDYSVPIVHINSDILETESSTLITQDTYIDSLLTVLPVCLQCFCKFHLILLSTFNL